jgi:hypothetical protein
VGEDQVVTELVVPSRFRGPPSSGNGGWTAGALAAKLADVPSEDHAAGWPTIQVTLRRPPPLDTPLPVADGAATGDDGVVAEATVVDRVLAEVEPVPPAEAAAAMSAYPGLVGHPFPTCFACGTSRAEGDGLRIFPGQVADDAAGSTRVAATWIPHASTAEDWWFLRSERSERLEGHDYAGATSRASVAVTWASLDCVGAWAADLTERLMVLGRMTARLDTLPRIGEPHVVMGNARGREGRKNFTAATLYDADGHVVGTAEHIWFEVDPADFS